MVKAVIDFTPLKKRIKKYEEAFAKKGSLTTQQIGRYGLSKIQLYMPRDTNQSVDSMSYMLVSRGSRRTEVQITQDKIPHPDKTWEGSWFNVPLFMFESPIAPVWPWRNGDINALRNVPDEMRSKFQIEIRKDLAEQWRLTR